MLSCATLKLVKKLTCYQVSVLSVFYVQKKLDPLKFIGRWLVYGWCIMFDDRWTTKFKEIGVSKLVDCTNPFLKSSISRRVLYKIASFKLGYEKCLPGLLCSLAALFPFSILHVRMLWHCQNLRRNSFNIRLTICNN